MNSKTKSGIGISIGEVSCDEEFFTVQEATDNYLDKLEKVLLIYYSTDERLVEFGLLVREYTL